MEKQETDIFQTSLRLFIRYGIRGVNMDDVAREMAISKKTLYKYVSNKDDLVDRCCRFQFDIVSDAIDSARNKDLNAIDELFAIDETICGNLAAETHPHLVHQLERYHPKTFQWLEARRREMIVDIAYRNLKRGVDQGMYLPDTDLELVAHFYYARAQVLSDESLFPPDRFNINDLMRAGLVYHIRGISTPEGLKRLNKYLNDSIPTHK